jgi:hypothetical protein
MHREHHNSLDAKIHLLFMETQRSSASLTSCQTKALDVLMREGNVFLTGAAGTGKSFLLDQYLRGKGTDDFPIVASTGAAAVIVGGRFIVFLVSVSWKVVPRWQ